MRLRLQIFIVLNVGETIFLFQLICKGRGVWIAAPIAMQMGVDTKQRLHLCANTESVHLGDFSTVFW